MKYYCPSCAKFVGHITKGSIRKGVAMVCAECMARYKIADDMANQVRERAHSDPTVEKLRGMFGMN